MSSHAHTLPLLLGLKVSWGRGCTNKRETDAPTETDDRSKGAAMDSWADADTFSLPTISPMRRIRYVLGMSVSPFLMD